MTMITPLVHAWNITKISFLGEFRLKGDSKESDSFLQSSRTKLREVKITQELRFGSNWVNLFRNSQIGLIICESFLDIVFIIMKRFRSTLSPHELDLISSNKRYFANIIGSNAWCLILSFFNMVLLLLIARFKPKQRNRNYLQSRFSQQAVRCKYQAINLSMVIACVTYRIFPLRQNKFKKPAKKCLLSKMELIQGEIAIWVEQLFWFVAGAQMASIGWQRAREEKKYHVSNRSSFEQSSD